MVQMQLNGKKALEYEIGQLEKLGTWVVKDLPEGQTAIPCSKITRVKQGPNSEIKPIGLE
jgi:hypothetical protein